MYECLSNTISYGRKLLQFGWLWKDWGGTIHVRMLERTYVWIYLLHFYDSPIQMCITLPGISEKMRNLLAIRSFLRSATKWIVVPQLLKLS